MPYQNAHLITPVQHRDGPAPADELIVSRPDLGTIEEADPADPDNYDDFWSPEFDEGFEDTDGGDPYDVP
jgi:hypothetical protein